MAIQDPVLYAVCDGEKARFLKSEGQHLRTFRSFDARSGAGEGDAPSGSVREPRSDPHVQIKKRFAREMANEINAAFAADEYLGGLVLAAPAHALHDIREHLARSVSERIVCAEAKDLTNIPDHDLLEHFDRPATGWRLN